MARADRARRTALLLLAALAGCAPSRESPPAAGIAGAPAACRVGPDGGPPLAERGIGGTGAPAAASRLVERGIGGTGTPAGAALQDDRGIGGTGILGVITGFASICLAGREVALDDGVPVSLEGAAASAAALRAGQVAAVEATGSGAELRARRIRIRHEVSGPVEAREANGLLRVAGQPVAVTAETLGDRTPAVGEWVAVSGLRRPDGVVQATRLDRRAPGAVTVHGVLRREGTTWRIGTLEVRPPGPAPAGQQVTVSGHHADGVLHAETLTPDLLLADPLAYFGPAIGVFLVEAWAMDVGGRLRLGPWLEVAGLPGLGPALPRRAVVSLERQPGRGLLATGLRESGRAMPGGPGAGMAPPGGGVLPPAGQGPGGRSGGDPGGAAARRSEPAPMPNRMPGLDGPGQGGRGGFGGAAPGGGAMPGGGAAPGGGGTMGQGQGGPGFGPPGSRSGFGPADSPGAPPGGRPR